MSQLEVFKIEYKGIKYDATCIPDVFTNTDYYPIIGSHSLDVALFDDIKGYPDEEARYIDEKIYGFVNDDYFQTSYEEFLSKVKKHLD